MMFVGLEITPALILLYFAIAHLQMRLASPLVWYEY